MGKSDGNLGLFSDHIINGINCHYCSIRHHKCVGVIIVQYAYKVCGEGSTLHTSNLQFGFKKKLSATIATTIFTETVDYYLNQGGVVYALALDASKAFDRVEFSKMFNNLLDRGLNVLYTRLLFHMYVQQTM